MSRLSIFYRIFTIYFDAKERNHVKSWQEGEEGAYRDPYHWSVLEPEIKNFLDIFLNYIEPTDLVLDLGCNVGRVMSYLNENSIRNLHGVDIMKRALDLTPQFFPELINNKRSKFFHMTFADFYKVTPKAYYDCTFSRGATIELIHLREKIITNICDTTKKYVFLIINENAHSYPKFYIYEFYRNSFDLIYLDRTFSDEKSIMIFKKKI